MLRTHAGRQDAGRVDLSISASTRRMVGLRLLAASHQHDALHDIIVVVLAGDAEPRREADVDVGDIAHAAPAVPCAETIVLRMSSREWISPTPRTTAA